MKKETIIVCLFSLFLMKIQAQDTLHLSLENLLQQVESNYPSIIQYQHTIQALQSKAEGAKAWMPPTFSTGPSQWPYNLSKLNESGHNSVSLAGWEFSVEQMIPNQTKLKAKSEYLNSLAIIEESKSNWTKNELRKEAKILYYSRYSNEQKKKIIDQSKGILTLLLTTAEEKFSNNQTQLQTIYKAKARLAELRNMQLMLEEMIAESTIGMNILMLKDANTVFKIDTLIKPQLYSNVVVDSSVVSKRSDIMAVSKSIQSMQLEQKIMQLGTKPDFGVKLENMIMFGMPSQFSFMGMITIPIVPWSSKMYTSDAKAMGFQIQAMEQEKLSMQLMAKRMLTEKLSMLRYEILQYENYNKEIIPAYENNLQVNLLAYKQNTGDFFVLLDAWEMLLMKKMEMYDKLYFLLKLNAEYEYENEIK